MDVIGSVPAAVLLLIVGIPLVLAFVFGRQLWRLWRGVRRSRDENDEGEDR